MLSGNELDALLDHLCAKLGFCLPDDARARLRAAPSSDAKDFARAVFDAEGLDPSSPSNRQLFHQVLSFASQAYDDAIRVRLMWAVQALAQPANVQVEMFPEFVVTADELALDLEDAWMLAQDRGVLKESFYGALQPLRDKLNAMSALGDEYVEDLWTREALQQKEEWTEVRRLATDACGACGWSVDCPPIDPGDRGTTYVQGN